MKLGIRLSEKRKELGMTQAELADKMHVTRQTISRWEAGMVYPDIEKIAYLAKILNVSCDYLLLDNEEIMDKTKTATSSITSLLKNLTGKKVKLTFYDDEEDFEVSGKICRVTGFEGNWMQIEVFFPKESKQKLVAIASILSVEILTEE